MKLTVFHRLKTAITTVHLVVRGDRHLVHHSLLSESKHCNVMRWVDGVSSLMGSFITVRCGSRWTYTKLLIMTEEIGIRVTLTHKSSLLSCRALNTLTPPPPPSHVQAKRCAFQVRLMSPSNED